MTPLWLGCGKTSFNPNAIGQSAAAGGALHMRLPKALATAGPTKDNRLGFWTVSLCRIIPLNRTLDSRFAGDDAR
jgi:hypothetical protein